MGWRDTYRSHHYSPLYWSSFIRALFKEFPDLCVTTGNGPLQINATTDGDATNAIQDIHATTQADLGCVAERPVSLNFSLE